MKLARSLVAPVVLTLGLGAGCGSEPGRLVAEIVGPAEADPLVFHGNCFAGWQLRVELRVRESGGTAVWIERLDYRLQDEGLGVSVVEESLDSAAIEERYGESLVPPNGSRVFPLGAPSGERPIGPVVLSGTVAGRDDGGSRVTTSFRLAAPSLLVRDPDLGPGGACPPPAAEGW